MRLTLEIIRQAPQFTNTLQQREMDLRGLGLTVLEERPLLLLNDSFDVLNLSQNPLVRLEYFPGGKSSAAEAGMSSSVQTAKTTMMLRLQSLIVHRNRLSHVSVPTCAAVLPNLRAFLADHNEFRELRDLLFLAHWKHLEIISIEHNPVTLHENEARFRAFVVFLCPKLKLVNYQRVTQIDRRNVEEMKTEFRLLLKEWQKLQSEGISNISGDITLGAACSASTDVKKLRKRGREARAAAAASGEVSGSNACGDGDGGASNGISGAHVSSAAAVGTDPDAASVYMGAETTQARLEALEAKMAAAETEEELMEIQQEIMDLEVAARQEAAAAKSKRARTS